MNRKEAVAILEDRDYWKNLCKEISNKNTQLEESLLIYKKENDNFETSTHIDEFLYEFTVNEKGEIPCLIKVNGVEHSFGITEKDANSFIHFFKMNKMKNK